MKKRIVICIIMMLLVSITGCSVGNESISADDIKMVITQSNEIKSQTVDGEVITGYPTCVIYKDNGIDKYVSLINELGQGIQYVGGDLDYANAISISFIHNDDSVEQYVFGVSDNNNFIEYIDKSGNSKVIIYQNSFDELFKIMSSEPQYTYLILDSNLENVVTRYEQLCLTCSEIPTYQPE